MNRLAIALCVLLLAACAYGDDWSACTCTCTDGQIQCPGGFGSDNDLPSSVISTTAPQFSVGYDATNKLNVSAMSGGDVTLAPSGDVLTFQNAVDSTTGLQVLDADGGVPILNVDTVNERVGIGTASPADKFVVKEAGATTFLTIDADAGYNAGFAFSNNAIKEWHFANIYSDNRFSFTESGIAEWLVIKSGGGVGLSTTAPDTPLEVNAATGGAIRLTYNDSDGTAANYVDQSVTSGGDLTVAPSGGNVALSAVLDIGAYASPITLEGATANEFETTIAVTDPTADQTATLPNARARSCCRATARWCWRTSRRGR